MKIGALYVNRATQEIFKCTGKIYPKKYENYMKVYQLQRILKTNQSIFLDIDIWHITYKQRKLFKLLK